MKITEIQQIPTTIATCDKAVHESIFRAYHIVEAIKYYLKNQVPSHIILELISEMEASND